MVDFLYNIDVSIFYLLNQTISNPLFDSFFPYITNVKSWYLVYIIFWLILIFKSGRIGKISAILIIQIKIWNTLRMLVVFGRLKRWKLAQVVRVSVRTGWQVQPPLCLMCRVMRISAISKTPTKTWNMLPILVVRGSQ